MPPYRYRRERHLRERSRDGGGIRAGQRSNHRECLWQLRGEVARTDRLVLCATRGRTILQQGVRASDRIRTAGLRDLRGRVAEDSPTAQRIGEAEAAAS